MVRFSTLRVVYDRKLNLFCTQNKSKFPVLFKIIEKKQTIN